MRDYKPSTPRAVIGLAAVAMTALTMSLTVIWPANAGADSTQVAAIAVVPAAAPI